MFYGTNNANKGGKKEYSAKIIKLKHTLAAYYYLSEYPNWVESC